MEAYLHVGPFLANLYISKTPAAGHRRTPKQPAPPSAGTVCEIVEIVEHICFLTIFHDFWGLGASRRQLRRGSSNKLQKVKQTVSILGSYFGPVWLPNSISVHFVCANLYAYFWHRFWEASCIKFSGFGGHFRVPFGVILNTFSQMLRIQQNGNLDTRNP